MYDVENLVSCLEPIVQETELECMYACHEYACCIDFEEDDFEKGFVNLTMILHDLQLCLKQGELKEEIGYYSDIYIYDKLYESLFTEEGYSDGNDDLDISRICTKTEAIDYLEGIICELGDILDSVKESQKAFDNLIKAGELPEDTTSEPLIAILEEQLDWYAEKVDELNGE